MSAVPPPPGPEMPPPATEVPPATGVPPASGVPPPPAEVPPPPAQATATEYAPAATTRPTNQMAIISLAAGVASFIVVPVLGAIVAVVTGHMARHQIKRTGEDGNGLALIGLILGYVHLLIVAAVIIFFVAIFGFAIFAATHGH